MRERVAVSLGKTLTAVFHLEAKQSTCCGGPVWQKTWKHNSFCVEVVWQTKKIVQHLIQTTKSRAGFTAAQSEDLVLNSRCLAQKNLQFRQSWSKVTIILGENYKCGGPNLAS